jgi:hypothetical protein
MRLFRSKVNSYAAMRRRMIAETELAVLIGLRFPDRMPRIPMMEVGRGSFHPKFAADFWAEALGIDAGELAALEAAYGQSDLMSRAATPFMRP